MAHRDQNEATRSAEKTGPKEVTVRLVDVEPFAGLCAATARFCGALTPDVYAALPQDATEALSVIQGIMWRLEHSNVEKTQ